VHKTARLLATCWI